MTTPIEIFNDSNRFTIDWTLNTLCTYHCSYCPPELHRGRNVFRNREEDQLVLLNFLNKLRLQLKDRSVHIFINGGEPTISPVFETLLDFIDSAGWSAYVNTNASRSLDWWQQYAKKAFKITVSYHPESVNDDEIFEKVEYISTQTNVGVFTLMYPPLWDKAVNAYNRFKTMPAVTVGASRVFKRDTQQVSSSYEYSLEQLAWLEENSRVIFKTGIKRYSPGSAFGQTFIKHNDSTIERMDEVELVNKGQNKFLGWSCTMGQNHLFIDSNWNIRPATCNTLSTFTTIEKFDKLLSEDVYCRDNYCMCTADVMIPKKYESVSS